MRDGHDPDSEYEAMTPEDDYYNQRKRSRLLHLHSGFDSAAESEVRLEGIALVVHRNMVSMEDEMQTI